jgi:hypothetical protein
MKKFICLLFKGGDTLFILFTISKGLAKTLLFRFDRMLVV